MANFPVLPTTAPVPAARPDPTTTAAIVDPLTPKPATLIGNSPTATLSALMARQKMAADRQGGIMSQGAANIPQGLSQLAWTFVNAMQENRAAAQEQEGRQQLASLMGGINMDTGPTSEQLGQIMSLDPDLGEKLYAAAMAQRAKTVDNWVDIPPPEGAKPGQLYQRNSATGEIRVAGGGGVNIDTGGEGEFEKKVAAQQAETFATIYKDSLQAAQDEISVGELENIFKTAGTGTSAGMRVWAKQKLGLELGDDVNDLQAADAIISKLVPAQRPAGSGTMSDRDIALFRSSLPSIWNQPGGNAKIMRTMKGIIEYRKAQGAIASAVMNGQMSREEGFQKLMAIPNPLANAADDTTTQPDTTQPDTTTQQPALTPDQESGAVPYQNPDGTLNFSKMSDDQLKAWTAKQNGGQ